MSSATNEPVDGDQMILACNNNNNGSLVDQNQLKKLYEELAEKEQALIMAAQFGKNLIDEKEDLERQVDNMKRDHQLQVDNLEQELYQLKRLTESMRNEYDTKIYELNEDINLLNRKLKQKELQQVSSNVDKMNSNNNRSNLSINSRRSFRNRSQIDIDNIDDDLSTNSNTNFDDDDLEYEEVIQELTEKNQKLVDDLKSSEIQFQIVHENCQVLESKLAEKESIINDDAKLINNFQKEIAKFHAKQQEMEFIMLQTYNERDKQMKIIEDLTQKLFYIENEKNELEHLIYQHESQIFSLQRMNQDLLIRVEKLSNTHNSSSSLITSSSNYLSLNNKNLNSLNRKRRSSSSLSNTPSQTNVVSSTTLNNNQQMSDQNGSNNKDVGHDLSLGRALKKPNTLFSDNFSNRSYLDSEYDDMDANADLEMCRINEIEQDDDDYDNSIVFMKSGNRGFLDELEENESMEAASGAVNWLKEVSEQRLMDNDESNISQTNENSNNNNNSTDIVNDDDDDEAEENDDTGNALGNQLENSSSQSNELKSNSNNNNKEPDCSPLSYEYDDDD